MKKKSGDDANILSWIAIVILLRLFAPAGIFFLVSKLFGRDLMTRFISIFTQKSGSSASEGTLRSSAQRSDQPEQNSSSKSRAARFAHQTAGPNQVNWEKVQAARAEAEKAAKNADRAVRDAAETAAKSSKAAAAEQKSSEKAENAAAKRDTVKADDGIDHISRGKKVLFAFGWVLIAIGLTAGIMSLGTGTIWQLLQFLAVILGGGGMLFASHTKGKKERLYQSCVNFVGDKAAVDLKAIAKAAGIKPQKLEKELDEMLERGYFPAAAYYDNEHDTLILDPSKAPVFQTSAASAGKQEPENAEQDEYDALLRELEQTCGRIQDREMLEKSVQIRGLTAAIFHAVRENPKKVGQITNFLNYYFPTTLKLLDSYADFEEKGYQGEKLQQTRERIEATADTVIAAYQKQLDNLYLPDTLDVDTDIDVLETMLKRDGLSESDFGQSGTMGGH